MSVPGFTAHLAAPSGSAYRGQLLARYAADDLIAPAGLWDKIKDFFTGGGNDPDTRCYTDTKCIGVVMVCKNCCDTWPPGTRNCGNWYACGGCFGFDF